MARSPLSNLRIGQEAKIKFHGSKRIGNEPYEAESVFKGYVGEGDTQRALFEDFELYKYSNRWVYGSGAHLATLIP